MSLAEACGSRRLRDREHALQAGLRTGYAPAADTQVRVNIPL